MKQIHFTLALFCFSFHLVQAQLTLSLSSESNHCFGESNGWAKVVVSGGTQPYTYNWTNSQGQSIGNTDMVTGLAAGSYQIKVSDAGGDLSTGIAYITAPPALAISLIASSQLCANAPDGYISALASGGTPPYAYSWSNGATTPQITGLAQGNYTLTVTDAQACSMSASASVTFTGEGLWISTVPHNSACPALNTGSVSAMPMSGTAPYTYLWSNGATGQTALSLGPGSYTVSITDAHGCLGAYTETVAAEPLPTPPVISIANAFCLQTPSLWRAPDSINYNQFHWTSSNGADQFLTSPNAASTMIQWGSPGTRSLQLEQSHNFNCTLVQVWALGVVSCASGAAELEPASVQVSPNPFFDEILIQQDKAGMNDRFELYDVNGHLLAQATATLSGIRLDAQVLPKGLYLLRMTSDNHMVKTWKLLK